MGIGGRWIVLALVGLTGCPKGDPEPTEAPVAQEAGGGADPAASEGEAQAEAAGRLSRALIAIHEEGLAMGELARERGTTDRVRGLGKVMAQDHRRLLDDARRLAGAEAGDSSDAGASSGEPSDAVAALAAVEGEAFDLAFLEAAKETRAQAIEALREMGQNVADGPLRDQVDDVVPLLEQERILADELLRDVRGS